MVIYSIKIVKICFDVIFDVDQNADVRIKINFPDSDPILKNIKV
jgi:hypothetical protein